MQSGLLRAVAMPVLPPATPVEGRAKLYRFRGAAKKIPPAVTYFPTQSPKQYRRR